MSEAATVLREVLRELDARVPGAVFDLLSVDAEAARTRLRRRGLPFADPSGPPVTPEQVEATARAVIRRARVTGAGIGVVGGFGGWVGAPSEVVAWVVAVARLAQRLAVVHGLDPASPRGRAAVARALAAGFEVPYDEGGPATLTASALARLDDPDVRRDVRGRVAKAVVGRATRLAVGRVTRWIPGLSSGVGAWGNQREIARVGERMIGVLARLADGDVPLEGAVEVREVGGGR